MSTAGIWNRRNFLSRLGTMAAADTPPALQLTDYNNMGYDLLAFSGGRAPQGPRCSILLLGRRPMIHNRLVLGKGLVKAIRAALV